MFVVESMSEIIINFTNVGCESNLIFTNKLKIIIFHITVIKLIT